MDPNIVPIMGAPPKRTPNLWKQPFEIPANPSAAGAAARGLPLPLRLGATGRPMGRGIPWGLSYHNPI